MQALHGMREHEDRRYYAPALVLVATVAGLALLSWRFPERVLPWVREQAGMSATPYLPAVPAALALEALLLLQLAAYAWALRRAMRAGEPPRLRLILATASACFALYLASASLLSADAYLYDGYARMTLQGHNPYLHAPGDFPDDPVHRFNLWWDEPDPYGPLWTALWTPLAAVAGERILIGLALGRVLGAAFYLLGVAVLLRLGEGLRWAAFAFAWNPLVLQEALGNGRVDVPMAVLLLLALLCLRRGRPWLGAAVLGLAVAMRFTAVIAVPFYALALAAGPGPRVRRLARAAGGVAAAAAVVVAAYAPYWAGPATLAGLGAAGSRYGNAALSSVINRVLSSLDAGIPAPAAWLLAALPAAALLLAWLRWGRRAADADARLAQDLTIAYVLYLWLVSPHIGAWYAAWPVVLALGAAARRAPGEELWIAAALALWGLGLYAVWQIMAWGLPPAAAALYELALLAWPALALALYVLRRSPWGARFNKKSATASVAP